MTIRQWSYGILGLAGLLVLAGATTYVWAEKAEKEERETASTKKKDARYQLIDEDKDSKLESDDAAQRNQEFAEEGSRYFLDNETSEQLAKTKE